MPIPIPPKAPKAIAQYLGRCSASEELVAWWEMPLAKDPHEAMWVITFDRPRQIFLIMSFPEVVSHWSHQLYGSNDDPAILRRHLASGLWSAPEAVKSTVDAFLSSLNA